jgi:uncharacterized protein YjiS (DUF1127 family)
MATLPLRSSYATLAAPRRTTSWRQSVARAVDLLIVWNERTRQRRQLRSLSDHMLHDIGLGRGDIESETSKPFWRA